MYELAEHFKFTLDVLELLELHIGAMLHMKVSHICKPDLRNSQNRVIFSMMCGCQKCQKGDTKKNAYISLYYVH